MVRRPKVVVSQPENEQFRARVGVTVHPQAQITGKKSH